MKFRGYTYVCVCGRLVKGQYQISNALFETFGSVEGMLDRNKAVCQQARAAAKGQVHSTIGLHYVGCGRTLAESDAEREKRREVTP